MQVTKDDVGLSLTSFQFYGVMSGARSTAQGLVEFNEHEQIGLLLLGSFFGSVSTDNSIVDKLKKINSVRDKYKTVFGYKQIAADDILYQVYMSNYQNLFTNGITLFELNKVVDIAPLLANGHFLQTQLMTDSQANQIHCSVAEFLQNAQYFYNEAMLYHLGGKEPLIQPTEKFTPFIQIPNFRKPSTQELFLRYLKESFINLILFVESFVNAVAYDAYLKNITFDSGKQLNLLGKGKSGNPWDFLSIRNKFKLIPKIINTNLLKELDLEQEPYKTYFNNLVELRNTYVHNSPAKGNAWLSSEEWKEKNDLLIDKICLPVIEGFWKTCYPDKRFPLYLHIIYNSDGFMGRQKYYYPRPY